MQPRLVLPLDLRILTELAKRMSLARLLAGLGKRYMGGIAKAEEDLRGGRGPERRPVYVNEGSRAVRREA